MAEAGGWGWNVRKEKGMGSVKGVEYPKGGL